jgi:tetrahydromethanopterin S-methyltransferase subunit G
MIFKQNQILKELKEINQKLETLEKKVNDLEVRKENNEEISPYIKILAKKMCENIGIDYKEVIK